MVGRIGFVSGFVVGVGFLVAMTWDLPWTVSRTLMVAGSGLLMGLLIGLAVWMMERFNYSK
jgi:hydrogenase/urease accessory protein HupE